MKTRSLRKVSLAALFVCTSEMAMEEIAVGGPIDPGFDLFRTLPFHSEFLGIDLMGRAFGPGNTDTIIARLDPIPAGDTGMIEVELVALSLQSVGPVDFPGLGMVDLFVTANPLGLSGIPQPDSLAPSVGEIQITSHDDIAGGGMFISVLDVFGNLILTMPGGDPNDPAQILFHQPLDALHLENPGAMWSHTPALHYPIDPNFPSGGFFITADGIPHRGEHPVVPSQVPEPSALIFLGTAAIVGFGAARRAHR